MVWGLKFSPYHWYYSAWTDVNISSDHTSINRILYWRRFQNWLSTRLLDLDLRVIVGVSRAPALTYTLLHSAHNNYGQITDVFAITVTSPRPPPAHRTTTPFHFVQRIIKTNISACTSHVCFYVLKNKINRHSRLVSLVGRWAIRRLRTYFANATITKTRCSL